MARKPTALQQASASVNGSRNAKPLPSPDDSGTGDPYNDPPDVRELAIAQKPKADDNGPVGIPPAPRVNPLKLRAVPGYVPFPTPLLPKSLQDLVNAGSQAIGCDPTFIALPGLSTLSAAIGATRRVEIKPGWREPPFVSTAVIAASGAKKSPPFKLAAEDPAEDINDRLDHEYREELRAYEDAEQQWSDRKRGEDRGPRPRSPVGRQFSFSNITLEALLGKLVVNPRGALIHRDELDGWLKSFTRYAGKGSSDLPDWLSLFNAATINNSRKTGDLKDFRVRGVGVAVTGTIQPSVLKEAMRPEFMAAGLFARLAIAMPPPVPRVWSESEVHESVTGAYGQVVQELFQLSHESTNEHGRRLPVVIQLSQGAKSRFIEFYNRNGQAIDLAEGDEAAARSKMEGYAARFALIFHCCQVAPSEVIEEQAMCYGIAVAEWFINESLRVYTILRGSNEETDLRDLFEKVSAFARKRRGSVTPRDLHKSNKSRWPTAETAELTLESLVDAGLGEWLPATSAGEGRPTRRFTPKVDPENPKTS